MDSDKAPTPASARAWPEAIAVVDAERTMTVTWADGHASRYPYWYLRGFCPCAVCQGHGQALTFVGEPDGPGPDMDTIHEVGHYAMNITWNDGHKTGIYTLDTLRNMCPCPVCSHTVLGQRVHKLLPQSRRDELV